jgi:hypothetical protein
LLFAHVVSHGPIDSFRETARLIRENRPKHLWKRQLNNLAITPDMSRSQPPPVFALVNKPLTGSLFCHIGAGLPSHIATGNDING